MRVLVVDDDIFVTMSLKTILESDSDIQVVAIGNNGEEAVKLYNEHKPDVLLMDIRMDIMTGLEAAEKIFADYKDANILFLTTFSDDEYIIKALHLGARGYLLKQDFESIIPALKAAYSGQSVFGGQVISKIPNLMAKSDNTCDSPKGDGVRSACGGEEVLRDDLTKKELEVMEQVAQGLNNKEIAANLYLSEGTVRNYISTILEKLGLRDRTQLAIYYLKRF
ncbi:MAG: response regulator transcription factor [Lachnospiraceae bacterium]|nr:response regulator transcription factor [Lachnospiraceae bacterium]